jgi:hypothetical protein
VRGDVGAEPACYYGVRRSAQQRDGHRGDAARRRVCPAAVIVGQVEAIENEEPDIARNSLLVLTDGLTYVMKACSARFRSVRPSLSVVSVQCQAELSGQSDHR